MAEVRGFENSLFHLPLTIKSKVLSPGEPLPNFLNSRHLALAKAPNATAHVHMGSIGGLICIVSLWNLERCETYSNFMLQVEPGKPGAEVSKNKNYKSKKEFAYRMCTG